jgi:hypothetical protein
MLRYLTDPLGRIFIEQTLRFLYATQRVEYLFRLGCYKYATPNGVRIAVRKQGTSRLCRRDLLAKGRPPCDCSPDVDQFLMKIPLH